MLFIGWERNSYNPGWPLQFWQTRLASVVLIFLLPPYTKEWDSAMPHPGDWGIGSVPMKPLAWPPLINYKPSFYFSFLFFSASYLNVHGKGRISTFYLLFLFLRLQWHNLPFLPPSLVLVSIPSYSLLHLTLHSLQLLAELCLVFLISIYFFVIVSCKDNVTVLFLLIACLYYWYFQEIFQCAYRKSEVDIMGLNLLF